MDDVKPVVPLTRKQTVVASVVGGGCGVAMVVVAAWLVLNVVSCVTGPKAPAPPAAAPTTSPMLTQIRGLTTDVIDVRLVDGLLMIQLAGDWSEYGATRFACETVKPIAGDQLFAIYDRFGAVIATGSRC